MKIEDLSAGYRGKAVVPGVNLEIKKGEIISFIGPNGAGKSTLLKTLYRELTPVAGAVFIDGADVSKMTLKELAKKLSIVTTDRIKPEHMTCREVVMAGRLPYTDGFGVLGKEDRQAAEDAIALMKIEGFADKQFSNLSDGQKQRTLIARAIAQSPEYLVMDEPTSYLDIRYRMELMEVLEGLAKKGVTIVMSIHELELAVSVSDRLLLVYDDGKTLCKTPLEVMEEGLIKDLFSLTDEMYEKIYGKGRI
ncbi:MAG: ABC transporter ATP-binding protein [Butyrivibrio sp.]|uniref:ABC transporter ATP-binding protein n=1 Tax=Butyrivibrio sp. LB2008 TaxID=1408305 RepID=UPI000687FB9D|nr:ABC transporter ATP-binding protein [Butyrivibrio sp. LB2008]MEE3495414.1 ABC transporter ATP-binding protein [Butyrivibrio sp.]